MSACRKLVTPKSTKVDAKPTLIQDHFEAASQAKSATALEPSNSGPNAQGLALDTSCVDDNDISQPDKEDEGDGEDSDEEEMKEVDDEEDENDGKPDMNDRADWQTINSIADDRFEDHVRTYCSGLVRECDIQVVLSKSGTYNRAVLVKLTTEGLSSTYVVRVPAHGSVANWTEDDAYVLDREVDLIKYIRAHTSAPVPHIVHHSPGHDNELGFPFILMAELPGKGAQSVWFEQPYNEEAFMSADVPPTAVQKKRFNLLRAASAEDSDGAIEDDEASDDEMDEESGDDFEQAAKL